VVAKISNAQKNILEKGRAKILLARKNFVKKAMVLTSSALLLLKLSADTVDRWLGRLTLISDGCAYCESGGRDARGPSEELEWIYTRPRF